MSELDNGAAAAAPDDNAVFDAIVSRAELPKIEAETKPVEIPAAPAPTPEPEDRVPSSRLREEAEARRKWERQAAEWQARYEEATRKPQEPQHKPDIFENASEFVRTEVSPEIQALRQTIYMQDRRLAVTEHGKDKVEKAQALFDELLRDQRIDPVEAHRVMSSPQPFSEAVSWYDRYQTLQEVGTDPAAYKKRVREELMKDQAFVAEILKQARESAPKVGGPAAPAPSLPSLTRVGSAAVEQGSDALSDDEEFEKLTNRRRKR